MWFTVERESTTLHLLAHCDCKILKFLLALKWLRNGDAYHISRSKRMNLKESICITSRLQICMCTYSIFRFISLSMTKTLFLSKVTRGYYHFVSSFILLFFILISKTMHARIFPVGSILRYLRKLLSRRKNFRFFFSFSFFLFVF